MARSRGAVERYTSNEQNPRYAPRAATKLTVTGANGCTSMATAIVELDTDAPGAEATGAASPATTTA
ncbi:MAG: hypothetical protein IPL52_10865 [Flavobacteriales bacterium]|nr:hypothetical protein [Flavobacteriales bacterium]